ncbi:MAG: hypothetical protein QOG23_4627 [Blastocatellia bacterium]|jgi:hypothetical protein|nr:hypothetical protein [Blastocatellia bacterium]
MNEYPKDWSKIAARVRGLAGNRCQRCSVGPGELYTRFSGKVVSEREFARLGKAATQSRLERDKEHRSALARRKERFLSPYISEAEMSGDYDEGYFAEGRFYAFDNDPKPSEMPRLSNNNRAYHFEVHHIDGDKSNNQDSNLECLCKRCHMYKTSSR